MNVTEPHTAVALSDPPLRRDKIRVPGVYRSIRAHGRHGDAPRRRKALWRLAGRGGAFDSLSSELFLWLLRRLLVTSARRPTTRAKVLSE